LSNLEGNFYADRVLIRISEENKTMRTPRWLRFALNPKSDELNEIRRRTDQMFRQQEAKKEQEGAGSQRETALTN